MRTAAADHHGACPCNVDFTGALMGPPVLLSYSSALHNERKNNAHETDQDLFCIILCTHMTPDFFLVSPLFLGYTVCGFQIVANSENNFLY